MQKKERQSARTPGAQTAYARCTRARTARQIRAIPIRSRRKRDPRSSLFWDGSHHPELRPVGAVYIHRKRMPLSTFILWTSHPAAPAQVDENVWAENRRRASWKRHNCDPIKARSVTYDRVVPSQVTLIAVFAHLAAHSQQPPLRWVILAGRITVG